MKLMWYADALSYKERGFAVTGLVYEALPMGAVPVAHNSIIDLFGVVSFMHKEQAYVETAPRDVIQFKYAENLQI